jgi:DNA-binding transcriptional LysR family regulator
MKIEQRDLEYFAVVAEHGNLGRAVEALSMSQPALSMSLRRLERIAGSKVVQRSGHIRAGTSFGVTDLRLVTACGRLLNEAPQETVTITGASPSELFSSLRVGDPDFMIGSARGPETDDFTQERRIEEEFVSFCSRRHRLARLKRLTWAALASQKWAENSSRLATPFAARGCLGRSLCLHLLTRRTICRSLLRPMRSLLERSAKRLGLVSAACRGLAPRSTPECNHVPQGRLPFTGNAPADRAGEGEGLSFPEILPTGERA